MSESFRIYGKSKTPLKYSSAPTRITSFQEFMGGAEGIETHDGLDRIPGEVHENLEERFNSGVNRTDVPRMWGYPDVDKRLGKTMCSLPSDLKGWRRVKGEVL